MKESSAKTRKGRAENKSVFKPEKEAVTKDTSLINVPAQPSRARKIKKAPPPPDMMETHSPQARKDRGSSKSAARFFKPEKEPQSYKDTSLIILKPQSRTKAVKKAVKSVKKITIEPLPQTRTMYHRKCRDVKKSLA